REGGRGGGGAGAGLGRRGQKRAEDALCPAMTVLALTVFTSRLSSPARDRRRADGWCRQAARETIKGSRRQDGEHRTGARKFLQGFDPGFRKPDTARRSRVGPAPPMNEH